MILFRRLLLFTLLCIIDALIVDSCTNFYDKKIVLLEITNKGGRPITDSLTYHVGVSNNKGSQQGGSESKGENTNSQTSVSVNAGLNLGVFSFGVQKSVTSSVGTSKETGYNWGSSTQDTFSKDTTRNQNFECPGFRICKVTQVVGYCDGIEIKTNKIEVDHELIKRLGQEPTQVPDAEIKVEGEVWVVARNLTFAVRSGSWERSDTCPEGSRVQGFQLKSKQLTGMTGYLLICSKRNDQGELVNTTTVQSGEGQTGTWRVPFESYFENNYATGFVYQTWKDSTGKLYKGNWKLIMEGAATNLFLPGWAFEVKRHETRCPRMHEVCGIRTMLDKDQYVVTDIGLKCCYHCEPREGFVVKDSYSNEGSTRVDLSYSISVGTTDSKDTSTSGNKQSDKSENTQGIHFSGLRAGFEATFGKSASSGFNWASSSNKMWSSNENKMISWSCPPFTLCTLKQLVGYCGTVEVVQTPHKAIEHKRLPNYEERQALYADNEENEEEEDEDYGS